VRGFDTGSLGQVDNVGAYIGGTRKLTVSNELFLPLPGSGNDRTLRPFIFLDAGNVWADSESIDYDSLRASAGFGISWISPVGPLKFSYAAPVKKIDTDRIQRFQFQIGTAF
jgi:outer membrane protein insertion porin family